MAKRAFAAAGCTLAVRLSFAALLPQALAAHGARLCARYLPPTTVCGLVRSSVPTEQLALRQPLAITACRLGKLVQPPAPAGLGRPENGSKQCFQGVGALLTWIGFLHRISGFRAILVRHPLPKVASSYLGAPPSLASRRG